MKRIANYISKNQEQARQLHWRWFNGNVPRWAQKVTKRHGILRETFPAVFIVELSHEKNAVERVSYSYTDVLTNNIILDFD